MTLYMHTYSYTAFSAAVTVDKFPLVHDYISRMLEDEVVKNTALPSKKHLAYKKIRRVMGSMITAWLTWMERVSPSTQRSNLNYSTLTFTITICVLFHSRLIINTMSFYIWQAARDARFSILVLY